jgi:uncharacterized membrane protein
MMGWWARVGVLGLRFSRFPDFQDFLFFISYFYLTVLCRLFSFYFSFFGKPGQVGISIVLAREKLWRIERIIDGWDAG